MFLFFLDIRHRISLNTVLLSSVSQVRNSSIILLADAFARAINPVGNDTSGIAERYLSDPMKFTADNNRAAV